MTAGPKDSLDAKDGEIDSSSLISLLSGRSRNIMLQRNEDREGNNCSHSCNSEQSGKPIGTSDFLSVLSRNPIQGCLAKYDWWGGVESPGRISGQYPEL